MAKKGLQETVRDITLLLTGRSIVDEGNKYSPSIGNNGGTTYISKQTFTITTSEVLGSSPALTIPPSTISAKVTAFSDSPLDLWVGRFYRDGTAPTNTDGIPVGNADERQFDSIDGLSAWRFRKLDAILSVTVIVEYWGA